MLLLLVLAACSVWARFISPGGVFPCFGESGKGRKEGVAMAAFDGGSWR